ATQWMTAGSGILHIETPPAELVESGGTFHGIQLWVNLPKKDKFATPRYQAIEGRQVKLLSSSDGGALLRIIAGDVQSTDGPGTGPGSTHTPITLLHATIQPGARLRLPWRDDFNALAYVLNGDGRVGAEGTPIRMGQLATFEGARTEGTTSALTIVADREQESRSPNLDVLILGGLPIGEKVAWYGPFVMNNETELHQAFADYRSGRLGQIPAEWVNSH
ncbi:MAG: pirin family protein, partial [Dehalococcoidia bacterium]|nr:pirin family protein [Dehalococcoidia bacterium]